MTTFLLSSFFLNTLSWEGFLGVLVVKNLPAIAGDVRDTGWIPRSGRSPGGGPGNPLQYSCLGNPMDRGACWATTHRVAKSQTRLKGLGTACGRTGFLRVVCPSLFNIGDAGQQQKEASMWRWVQWQMTRCWHQANANQYPGAHFTQKTRENFFECTVNQRFYFRNTKWTTILYFKKSSISGTASRL